MRKQFKKVALGLACAMAIAVTAPAAQTSYAGTTVYEVTLGTPERRAITEESLKVGETIDLNFYGVKDWNRNKDNYKCKWTASGDAVTVNNWGVVTAVKSGTAVITLTVTDKVTEVSHNIAPTTITVVAEPTATPVPTSTPTPTPEPTATPVPTPTSVPCVCNGYENLECHERYHYLIDEDGSEVPLSQVRFIADGYGSVKPKFVLQTGESDAYGLGFIGYLLFDGKLVDLRWSERLSYISDNCEDEIKASGVSNGVKWEVRNCYDNDDNWYYCVTLEYDSKLSGVVCVEVSDLPVSEDWSFIDVLTVHDIYIW